MAEELTENLSFFCTKEMAEQTRIIAAVQHISRSRLYRLAIAEYIKNHIAEVKLSPYYQGGDVKRTGVNS